MKFFSVIIKKGKIVSPILFLAFCFTFRSHLQHLHDTLGTIFERLGTTAQGGNQSRLTNDLSSQQYTEEFSWSNESGLWTLRDQEAKPTDYTRQERCIWPEDCRTNDDRIIDQLQLNRQVDDKVFKILPYDRGFPIGDQHFVDQSCPVNKCEITYNHLDADALIFPNSDVIDSTIVSARRANQVWIAYLLESPVHTFHTRFQRAHRGKQPFNWTASYRSDSDIVTPYAKFVPYQSQLKSFQYLSRKLTASPPSQELINASAEPKVAWFASNCNAANRRLEYAKELAKFIQVDIYGKCGNYTCDKNNQTGCHKLIDLNYKFYLSFENSNCHEYVTEKLYRNALGYNDPNRTVLPIVMGASKSDYNRLAPAMSFIHINDFRSPKELAKYLKYLDHNDDAFGEYFKWKSMGRFVDTKFMCRVCAMLHEAHLREPIKIKSYESIQDWWMFRSDATAAIKPSACEPRL